MSLGVKHAAVLLQLDDGRIVQRPMNAVEIDIVVAMLATHDTGTLKTIPAPGIQFKSTGEVICHS